MGSAAKSLGQFVTEVLSGVSSATYLPASVIVGSFWMSAVLWTSPASNPVDAIVGASSPSFGSLALFVVTVAIVAALIEPLQFRLTRFLEGYNRDNTAQLKEFDELEESFQKAMSDKNALAAKTKVLRERLAKLREEAAQVDDNSSADDGEKKAQESVLTELRSARSQLKTVSATVDSLNRQRESWPRRDRVLATTLGNTIRSYEDQSNTLLKQLQPALPGEPTTVQELLPYIHHALPEELRNQHDRFRGQLQTMTTLVAAVPAATVPLTTSLITFGWNWTWMLAVVSVSAAVTVGAHRGAVDAGDGYGTLLLAITRRYVVENVPTPKAVPAIERPA